MTADKEQWKQAMQIGPAGWRGTVGGYALIPLDFQSVRAMHGAEEGSG